jgi:mannose-6-phosphate isomerase-like protein (cupin superfamily)
MGEWSMTLLRSRKKTVGLLAILSAVAVAASTDAPRQPAYFAAADLRAGVAQPQNGLAATLLPAGIRMQAFMVHRDAVGEVEMHASAEHFYLAQAGEADVLLGRRVEGNHLIAPGEWRGGKILDAKPYRMKPGDVLWIPPGTAHQVVPEHGSFQYVALNADPRATP